jgi:hypothetical protein
MDVNLTPPKVVERKLGREHFPYGQQEEKLIEIDPRQTEKEYLGTLLHEFFHYTFPDLSERQVLKIEKNLQEILWKRKYRRIRA